MRCTHRVRYSMPPLFAALATMTWISIGTTRDASAQVIERFVLRGEGGAGTVFPGHQTTDLGYNVVVQGSGRLGFTIYGPIALQASFSSWFFPSDMGNGQQYSATGGIRIEPEIGRVGRLFIDGNFGAGFTGPLTRFTLDAGLGFEFRLHDAVGLGPAVRYGRLFATDPQIDGPTDAHYWSAGLSMSLRVPHRAPAAVPPPPGDRDRDTILDPQDLCPDEPQGSRPDPERPGCPVRDRDGDGVHDGRDSCPDVAAGDHPDPARAGCPLNDSDRDGVFDPQDQCPTTPAGPTPDPDHDRWGCPDGDTDADHVVNHQDQCPTEPPGLLPDPARPGCPLPDRDHDNVPDATDACPEQPGAPSPNPRRNGCPGLVSVDNRAIHINRPVFFATNSDRILPRSRPVLQAVADVLRAMPEIHHISVEGHTDDVGDDTRNMELSQRRAASVQQWLTQNGIDAARLESHGFGETRPLAQGTSAADRAQNRRVEFNILDVSMTSSAPNAPASAAPATTAPASPAPAASSAAPAHHAPAVRAPASVTSRPEVHAPAHGRRTGR